MNATCKVSSTESAADDVIQAIKALSIEDICDLRNQLITHELAVIDENDSIEIYSIASIESWAEQADFRITESDDLQEYPFNYWLNNDPSDISFATEREAMVAAFKSEHTLQ